MSASEDAVRGMIAAFNASDEDELRRCLDPGITVRRPLPDVGLPSHSDTGVYQGLDEVVPMLTDLQQRTGGIDVEVRQMEDVGEASVLFEFIAQLGPADGRTTWLGWSLFELKAGRVASTQTFATEAQAREAISRAG